MAQASRTFRIFVSSTFSDLKAERNALQGQVFPRLRELCLRHGARFQAIDLRWGVSEEASRDQRAMPICLEEIERCRRTTPRPNFVVLLGDRYGARPAPPAIPGYEWEPIVARCDGAERALLEAWYRRDDNAALRVNGTVWPEYVLQPREGAYEDYDTWAPVERQLADIFERATRHLPLEVHDGQKYGASATEQEIYRGALRVEGVQRHVHCFFRSITNLNELVRAAREDERARAYVNLDPASALDGDAHASSCSAQC